MKLVWNLFDLKHFWNFFNRLDIEFLCVQCGLRGCINVLSVDMYLDCVILLLNVVTQLRRISVLTIFGCYIQLIYLIILLKFISQARVSGMLHEIVIMTILYQIRLHSCSKIQLRYIHILCMFQVGTVFPFIDAMTIVRILLIFHEELSSFVEFIWGVLASQGILSNARYGNSIDLWYGMTTSGLE